MTDNGHNGDDERTPQVVHLQIDEADLPKLIELLKNPGSLAGMAVAAMAMQAQQEPQSDVDALESAFADACMKVTAHLMGAAGMDWDAHNISAPLLLSENWINRHQEYLDAWLPLVQQRDPQMAAVMTSAAMEAGEMVVGKLRERAPDPVLPDCLPYAPMMQRFHGVLGMAAINAIGAAEVDEAAAERFDDALTEIIFSPDHLRLVQEWSTFATPHLDTNGLPDEATLQGLGKLMDDQAAALIQKAATVAGVRL